MSTSNDAFADTVAEAYGWTVYLVRFGFVFALFALLTTTALAVSGIDILPSVVVGGLVASTLALMHA